MPCSGFEADNIPRSSSRSTSQPRRPINTFPVSELYARNGEKDKKFTLRLCETAAEILHEEDLGVCVATHRRETVNLLNLEFTYLHEAKERKKGTEMKSKCCEREGEKIQKVGQNLKEKKTRHDRRIRPDDTEGNLP